AVAEEVTTAVTEEASPPQDAPSPTKADATQAEQSNIPPAAETTAPATRLASQGDPSASVGETARVDAKLGHAATKPHLRAQRTRARNNAARARAARQQAAVMAPPPVFPLFEQQHPPKLAPAR